MKGINYILPLLLFSLLMASCSNEDFDELFSAGQETVSVSPLSRATVDPETLEDFRCTYGVGFSYDAIYGERCNLKDVRCQIFNYKKIEEWQNAGSGNASLITFSTGNEMTSKCEAYYSRSEYEQNTVVYADAKAELIIFNGEAQANLSMWEGGDVNGFFCTASYVCPSLQVKIDNRSLQTLVNREGLTELLSPNFLEVVEWMRTHRSEATIDSFLVRYGSHVVTSAKLGGSLTVRMEMQNDSLMDIVDTKVLSDKDVLGILESTSLTEEQKKTLHLLNSADCSVVVKGGDLSLIPNDLLHFTFGKKPDLAKYIKDWVNSISYDPDNYQSSNLEMAEMEVAPIWDFIPDEEVARLVKLRAIGTAVELLEEFGYQNVVNTTFKLPQSVTCQMGSGSATFKDPAVVNILASGRYVATVCRERIDAINSSADVQVVYPIYDRQINYRSGLCLTQGMAWKVRWNKGVCKVEKLGEVSDDLTVYLNRGVPDTTAYANINYQPAHAMIGYEWPGAIRQDGSLDTSKPYYMVYKQGEDFYLRTTAGKEQSGNLEGLPNWNFDGRRMVRNKDYFYYWNPKEINY